MIRAESDTSETVPITFRRMTGECIDISQDGPQTITCFFGVTAAFLCDFFIGTRILKADEIIEAGSVVDYTFLDVDLDIFYCDVKSNFTMALDNVNAVASSLWTHSNTTLEGIACLAGKNKKDHYKLRHLCAEIVDILKDAAAGTDDDGDDELRVMLRMIIDGIGEQMKAYLVANRNALHEMPEMKQKGRLYICFMNDAKGEICIRLKPPFIPSELRFASEEYMETKQDTIQSTMKKEIMKAYYYQ